MKSIDILKFLANKGAPHGLSNLYSPIVFIFGSALMFSGLFISQESNIAFTKWVLPTGFGFIVVIQSVIISNLVRLQEKYGENKKLIFRGVLGTLVLSLWISAVKTTIEFMIMFGGS